MLQLQHLQHNVIIQSVSAWPTKTTLVLGKVKVKVNVAPRRENLTSKALRCGSYSFTCRHTTPAFTAYSSPEGATTE